jgi:phosphohistidine phosphatase
MLLVLFRHGIAIDRADPACPPDPERMLTPKGKRRTRAAAAGLAALGVEPDLILSSPYKRARETAEIAADALKVARGDIQLLPCLQPDEPPTGLFETLAKIQAGGVLIAGHAPNLDLVLRYALDSGSKPLTDLKKAGAACLELRKPGKPGGRLMWLLEPSALRALAGTGEDD